MLGILNINPKSPSQMGDLKDFFTFNCNYLHAFYYSLFEFCHICFHMTDQYITALHNHKEIIPEAFIICQTSDPTARDKCMN